MRDRKRYLTGRACTHVHIGIVSLAKEVPGANAKLIFTPLKVVEGRRIIRCCFSIFLLTRGRHQRIVIGRVVSAAVRSTTTPASSK